MKRIGIITYHKANNYGTMLQAFALQTVIDDLDYEAEIINFIQDMTLSKREMFFLGCLFMFCKEKNIVQYIKIKRI